VGDHSYDAAFGDLDGDGNLDLVVVNRFQLNELLWGDGTGAFTRDTVQPVGLDAGGSRDVELADLDNDGDLDVYVANGPAEVNFLYANDSVGGTPGSFTRLLSDPSVTDVGTSYGAVLGDLDDDGLADLLVLNRNETNPLYQNVSAGGAIAFQRVVGSVLDDDMGDSYDASLGDLDADGDVDIVVANRQDNNFVYLATGEAEFDFVKITAGQAVAQRGNSRDVAMADLDADGFPEVVFANTLGGDNFLYDNLGPMWSDLGLAMGSSGDPTYFAVGQLGSNQPVVLTLENAPANSLVLLVTGLTTSFVPFRGGVIVPTPDIIGPALVTDSQGRLELPSQMPGAVPSALSLFLQALIQDNGLPQGVAFSNGLQGLTL
jgi:hypothetical protein